MGAQNVATPGRQKGYSNDKAVSTKVVDVISLIFVSGNGLGR